MRRWGFETASGARSATIGFALVLAFLGVVAPGVDAQVPMPSGGMPAGAMPAGVPGAEVAARPIQGLSVEVAQKILGADEGGALGLRARALSLPRDEGAARVALIVELDGAGLLDGLESERLAFEVFAYAIGADSSVADYLARAVSLDTRELGEAVFDSGVKFFGSLDLGAGDYRLRVLVRRHSSPSEGLVTLDLSVPSAPDAALVAVMPEPTGRDAWLETRDTLTLVPRVDEALSFGGLSIAPAAHPVVVAGRRSLAYVYGEPAPAADGRCRAVVTSAADPSGRAETVSCRREEASAALTGQGLPSASLSFELPKLEMGVYRLGFELGEGDSKRLSRPMPLLVLDAKTRERDLLWTDLRWLRSSGTEAPSPRGRVAGSSDDVQGRARAAAEEEEERRRSGSRRLRRSYRDALALLAAGDAGAAQSALLEMESTALGRSSQKHFAGLSDAEHFVVSKIAESDPEALVPLMVLHTRLYRTYVERRVFSLSAHSKIMLGDIVDAYVDAGGSPEIASHALTSLAGYLQEANLRSSSRSLFELALERNASQTPALLGLASLEEKFGNVRGSVRVLRQLVEVDPDDAEARLRLGIGLCRIGSGRQCRDMLRDVVGRPGPAWVKSLAFEVLARRLVDSGRLREATDILRRANIELPEELRPYLLAAYSHDRLGEQHEAIDLVRRHSVRRSLGGTSARLRYDSWPQEGIDRLRALLENLSDQRLGSLDRSLDLSFG